jgi:hypothetical protein
MAQGLVTMKWAGPSRGRRPLGWGMSGIGMWFKTPSPIFRVERKVE